MTARKKILSAALIVAVAAAGMIVYRMTTGPGSKKTRRTIAPEYGTIRSAIAATGTVLPRNRLEIKPPVNGRVESILVVEGQGVRKGQTLALMSSTERAAFIDVARTQDSATLKYWEDAYKPIPLIAPISGTVIVRAVEPGQTVITTTAILVLSDRLIVKAEIDETDIGRVNLGLPAAIVLDAHPDINTRGRVSHISYESKMVNNVTVYEVEIIPAKITKEFRSGMSANISIIIRENIDALLVPHEAVIIDERGSWALVTRGPNEPPEKRLLTTGMSDDRNVEVLAGITGEDRLLLPEKKSGTPAEKGGSNPFLPQRRRR